MTSTDRLAITADEKLARLEARISNELGPAGARIVEENRR